MRGIELLHPKARELAVKLVNECGKRGISIKIGETLRTKAEQDALYAQGRTKPGSIVTRVKYPFSFHCWGIGFDVIAWHDKDKDGVMDGNEIDWSATPYDKIGPIGEKLGLEWGGRFKSFKDRPHFQLPGYDINILIRMYKTPSAFISLWKGKVK